MKKKTMTMMITTIISATIGIVAWLNLFVATENRLVSPYSAMAVSGPIQVFAQKNMGDTVRLVADKGLSPKIATTVTDRVLTIEAIEEIRHERVLKVYIDSERLEKIFLTGSSTLEVVDKMVKDSISIRMSGSAEARLLSETSYLNVQMNDVANVFMAGNTQTLDMTLTGFSDIVAYNLVSKVCSIKINAPQQSPGIFRVSATDTLHVEAEEDNSRVVYYKGNPTVVTSAKMKTMVFKK